jgi:nitronate monooxygenase
MLRKDLNPMWPERLTLPLIVAPMTGVSTVEMVVAACRNGVIGSFPTHSASPEELPRWLERIRYALADGPAAPVAANVVVHRSNPRRDSDVELLAEHGIEVVITSVGSPAEVVPRLHDAGTLVFADVASMRHVDRALEAGVDGLVLLSAGAGGQTGWINPLAFLRAVRRHYDGPLVLAGGIADGVALAAATVAGATLCYMGTRFIATRESGASDAYREAVVAAGPDDVALTRALTGLPAHVLRNSPVQRVDGKAPASTPPDDFTQEELLSYRDLWGAGHTVCGVDAVTDVRTLVDVTRAEFELALEPGFPSGREWLSRAGRITASDRA